MRSRQPVIYDRDGNGKIGATEEDKSLPLLLAAVPFSAVRLQLFQGDTQHVRGTPLRYGWTAMLWSLGK